MTELAPWLECFNTLVICFLLALFARTREQTHGRDWFTVWALVLAFLNAVVIVFRIVSLLVAL